MDFRVSESPQNKLSRTFCSPILSLKRWILPCLCENFPEYLRNTAIWVSIIVYSSPHWFSLITNCIDSQTCPWRCFRLCPNNLCFSWHGSTVHDEYGSWKQRVDLISLLAANIFKLSLQKVWSTIKIHRDLTSKPRSSQNGRF